MSTSANFGTPLQGRLAAITGASSGIGKAIAIELSKAGTHCIINARREERLRDLQTQLNSDSTRVVTCPGDASSPETVKALFTTAKSEFGRVPDIIVVNAGRGLKGGVGTADLSKFDEIIRANLTSAAFLLQESSKNMSEDAEREPFPGKVRDIVVLGSISGRHVSPFSAAYGAVKTAVHSLAEVLRRELAPKGIRVTLLEPAIVLSEFQDVAGYDDEWRKTYAEKFGPLLVPADVARTVAFILQQPPHVHINNVVIRSTRQDYP